MPLSPALQGFLAARQQGQEQDANDLKQAGALQTLLATAAKQKRDQTLRESLAATGGDVEKALAVALQSGDVASAHALAPLVESKRKANEAQQLASLDMTDPDALRRAGTVLKKPEFITHAERIDKQRAQDAELATMRGTPAKVIQPDVQETEQSADQGTPAPQPSTVPGTPSIFASLVNSKVPEIAQAATNYQSQMNAPTAKAIAPTYWQNLAKGLQDKEIAQMNKPEPAAQLHTDADGRVWERSRDGTWNLAKGPDGKPLSSRGAGVTLDDDAIKVAGWEKLLWGIDPKGLGQANAQQRAAVQNERARLGKGLGLTAAEMAVLPQDNKVKQKAIDKLTTWDATVGRSAEKLDLDLKVAIDYAQKLPLGQIQMINKGVLAGRKEFNDPTANAYASAINSVRLEYSRLMSGPTSNAMLPVEAMKRGSELLSGGVDVASLQEVGNQMRRDAANTKTATQHQIGALRGTMLPKGTPVTPAAAPAAPTNEGWSIRPRGG
jgi:hypothetical protein